MPDNRIETFAEIKKLLKKYSPPLAAVTDTDKGYELVSKKEVVIAGRKKPEMYFAAAMIQKDFVGFYLMSVYAEPTLKKKIAPELLKALKGKSCFHIKTLDANLKKQIAEALKMSLDFYKKQGWG